MLRNLFTLAIAVVLASTAEANNDFLKVTPGCAKLISAFAGFGAPAVDTESRDEAMASIATPLQPGVARAAARAVGENATTPSDLSSLVAIDSAHLDRALAAFQVVFERIYGESFTCDSLSASADPLTRKMRCIWSLFYGKRNVPRQVLLGIENRVAARNKRIADLKKKIGDLRGDLGARADYLTPSALSAVEIFSDLGRSRNLGGGVRDALKLIARPVRDNLDDLFFTTSNAAGADDALMELLIYVSGLIYEGVLDPATHSSLRQACDDLIVSSFSPLGESLLPETIDTFESLATTNAMMASGRAKPFLDHVIRVKDWQKRLAESMESFATSYYKGRTAYTVLSLMSRPNGYDGMPLGSPIRDAIPSFDGHPDTLRLALLAHGAEKSYLSLSVGELLALDDEIRTYLTGEDTIKLSDRMLVPYLIGDMQLYAAFLQGYEYELKATLNLLKMEKRGVLTKWFAQFFGKLSGGLTRQALSRSKMVQQILPGKFVDALVQQAEVGMDPTTNEAAKFRKREVRTLPRNLPAFLIEDKDILPWLEDDFKSYAQVAAVAMAQANPVPPPSEKHDSDPDGPAPPTSPSFPSAGPVLAKEPATVASFSIPSRDGVADNYLWKILKKMERKAEELLRRDSELQRAAELGRQAIPNEQIEQLASEVRMLLRSTLDVLAAVESCFRANSLTMEDAEETFAWHLIKKAPTVAMYVVGGPPGPPRHNPAILTGLAGVSWRIVMLTPRLAYGDGMADEPIFVTSETDPTHRYRRIRRDLIVAALTAAGSFGVPYAVRKGVDYMGWEVPYVSSPKEVPPK